MKTSKSFAVIAATILTFAGASAQAQVITWGAATQISSDSDVATNGTLLYADYVGGPGTDTINGVNFTSVASPAAAGLSNYDAALNFGGTVIFGPPDASTGYTGSANYSTLLNGAYYDSLTIGPSNPGSLTLSGLTAGNTYELQVFVQDGRAGRGAGNYALTLTNGNSITLDASVADVSVGNGEGAGQYGIGTFVANGTTEVITTTDSETMQLNAFQVRDLGVEVVAAPEPSTYALMGLGALALVVISRRRCKA